jgi:hypothetical protein
MNGGVGAGPGDSPVGYNTLGVRTA